MLMYMNHSKGFSWQLIKLYNTAVTEPANTNKIIIQQYSASYE